MWSFSGYEKMADSSAAWRLDAAGFRALRRVPWTVTEKIHGANFCFVIAAGKVHGASRRRLLTEDEPFFQWQKVRDRLTPALLELARQMPEDAERVCVYGELFGGGYPHPEVAAVSGVAPIQTGIWYAPDIHYAAFDIALETGSERRYMDFEQARARLMGAGVPCVTPLRIGTYEQVTDFSPRFDSTIPDTLGLPPLPPGTNPAEGIVLRPMREITVAGAAGPIRPILKCKIPEFAEDRRFHEAERWQEAKKATGGNTLDLLKWEAYCRVTENRLDAAVSKVGQQPPRNRGTWSSELFTLLETEIMDEARAVDPALWADLSPAQQQEWITYVRDEIRQLLKTRFGST